jgi:hypothetical protein
VSLGTRISVIVADLIVLAVTCYKAIGIVRQAYLAGMRVPISEILLRDGKLQTVNDHVKHGTNMTPIGTLFFL